MRTLSPAKEDAKNGKRPRQWWLVNAEGKTLGRLATQIATLLRGKHKAFFAPHVDCGDFVIVVNAEKVALSGKKHTDKMYYRHTGYPGGLKTARAEEMLTRKPTALVYEAVKGMMPKNALNRRSLNKLKIYSGDQHRHESQQPKPYAVK